jgi:type I restriction enzyme S subunit
MLENKKTNIKWISSIPKEWKMGRLKDVIEVLTDYTANGSFGDLAKNVQYLDYEDYARLIRLTDLRDNLLNTGVYVSEESYEYLGKSKLFGGEILVANVGAYAGLFCEMPEVTAPATLGPNMFLIRTNQRMEQHFLYYLGNANFVWEQLVQKAISSAQPKLNKTDIKTIYIVIPPKNVQRKIASYLDQKCDKITTLIADVQSEIDTLEQYKRSVIAETVTKGLNYDVKMKDSGVQWIGDMPAYWKCNRGKYILKYIQKPVREDDGVITCFRDGEVTLRSNRREDGFTMSDKEIGYQGIDVGDLVVHGMDGFAGAIGISDSRGKASPVLNVLDTEQNKKYIMYYLRSMAYSDVFIALATGIRVRSCDLRWNKLAELPYPIPPIEEQNAIVEHIDKVLEKTNAVIAEKKAQLEILESYKKSLIYEYVTGKKEVPQQ